MFHKHKWVEIERFFAEPETKIKSAKNCSESLFQQLIQGVTTIRYKCDRCNKWKTVEILGKSMKEQNVIDKFLFKRIMRSLTKMLPFLRQACDDPNDRDIIEAQELIEELKEAQKNADRSQT